MSSCIYNMIYIFHIGYYDESSYYLLDFQNIFSNSIHPVLLKSKTIHTLFHFLLLKIVFKAITILLKDPNVLIILCILTVILPSFGLGNRSTLEIYTTSRYCWARNFTIKSKEPKFLMNDIECFNNMARP